jgi:cytochrome P450
MYQLINEKEVVTKMKEEIKEVVGDRLPGFHQLRQMPYTMQVIEEGLRMYPPVWGVSRTAHEADEFKGIKIEKNQTVFCTIYNAHHSTDLFPNPEKFDPERFSIENKAKMAKMSFLPFGGGPRLCIGNMFALMEMQLILVGLLQRFEFELIPEQTIFKEALVTVRPKFGIKMRVI